MFPTLSLAAQELRHRDGKFRNELIDLGDTLRANCSRKLVEKLVAGGAKLEDLGEIVIERELHPLCREPKSEIPSRLSPDADTGESVVVRRHQLLPGPDPLESPPD